MTTGGSDMWWIMALAVAEEAGTKLAPNFGPWDTKLAAVLASDGWYGTSTRLDTADPVALLKAIEQLDETALKPRDGALAWQDSVDEFTKRVGSNLRVKRDPDGSVAAVAFAVAQTDEGGRAMALDNTDVLVLYQAGLPTHAYQVRVERSMFSSWEKTLWTYARADGSVSVQEQKADHDYHGSAKPIGNPELTTVYSDRRLTL